MARELQKKLGKPFRGVASPGPAGRSNAGDLVKTPPANTLLRAAERSGKKRRKRRKI